MFTGVSVLISARPNHKHVFRFREEDSAAPGQLHYTSLDRLAICSVNMSGLLYRLLDDTFRQRD